jgi:aryl-alcohol dehydrogenase (NADP+)
MSASPAPTTSSAPLTPTRALGRTGLLVSPLALGGNVFGWTADPDASFAVLDAYTAAGGNLVDTADSYSHWAPGNTGGESERILGDWLAARGRRDDVLIATKVGKSPTAPGLSPGTIRRSCEESLRRLGTDHIDVYYAHQDDPRVPMADTLAAFAGLVDSGKVRFLGASNFTGPRLREALAVAAAEGLVPYSVTQDHYNLMERATYEADIAPVVAEHDLGSLPFFGLARGFLTGKYRDAAPIDSPRAEAAHAYRGPRGDLITAILSEIATAHEVTAGAVALAWLLTRPGVSAPLASARTPEQLAHLVPCGSLRLDPAEVAALDDASA